MPWDLVLAKLQGRVHCLRHDHVQNGLLEACRHIGCVDLTPCLLFRIDVIQNIM